MRLVDSKGPYFGLKTQIRPSGGARFVGAKQYKYSPYRFLVAAKKRFFKIMVPVFQNDPKYLSIRITYHFWPFLTTFNVFKAFSRPLNITFLRKWDFLCLSSVFIEPWVSFYCPKFTQNFCLSPVPSLNEEKSGDKAFS